MSTQKIGADYAFGRPRAKHLRDAGFRLVARYLSPDSSKNLDATERSALLKAGEDIVVVWESTADRATHGAMAGHADAVAAVKQLRALRGPKGMAVYFAVDGPYSGPQVHAYFDAARKVIRAAGFRIGGYGDFAIVEYLKRHRLVDVAWQTVAWSLGKVSPLADLYQRAQTRKIDGVTVDVDVICHPDYGGWQHALPRTVAARRTHEARRTPVAKKTRPRRRPGVQAKVRLATGAVFAFFRGRLGRLLAHDLAVAAGAATAIIYGSHSVDAGVLETAGLVGLKVLLRQVLPVPAASHRRR